ncbi:MAG: NAD-dependent malic enzyme [Acidimicrobiia bacterium]|nr:NAD-dependent malic enzyme [Acidimicrobiia bacterium]
MNAFDVRTDPETGERYMTVRVRGEALLRDPFLNKGQAFSRGERDALGLTGILPDQVASLERQTRRVRDQFDLKTSDMGKNVYLNGLMDRNETLFYRFVLDNLAETVPVVYTPTVALACSHWSRIYRRQRGIYITPRDRGRIAEILHARPVMEPPVIVVTDNERILGIGDQGAGGMGIPIGKLALYTAAAGIHPERCMPVSLDVGTNNAELLDDPLYIGYRQPRLRGAEYESLVDEFVDAVIEVYPDALLQWEDFANSTSFRNLIEHRDRIASFNDDIQGTAAMVVAGVLTGIRKLGAQEGGNRVVISGAGSAGYGIAEQLRYAMRVNGASEDEVAERIFVLDSRGLLIQSPHLRGMKEHLAVDPSLVDDWVDVDEPPSLLDVVRNAQATILIGVTGQPGLFTEDIVKEMASHVEHPIIMPLSNPTSHTEVVPAAALEWSDGRAIIATGSPFSPVERAGRTHRIGQANNSFIFPGMGLGVTAVRARRITDGMFFAAAVALSDCTRDELVEHGQIYPDVEEVREVARAVAVAVARQAIAEGVAEDVDDLEGHIEALMWSPEYLEMRPA